jgi:hypothetical protein
MRFGVVSTVFLDARASMDFYLGAQLQRLPLRVCGVRVRREALAVAGRRSALDVVAWQLPAHVRSLIFEHEGLASSGEGCTFDLLPPLSRWTLPAGLTELQLPHFLPLDEEIHKQRSGWVFSDEEEEEEEEEEDGRQLALPASLTELRLGAELSHSMTHVQLPSSLRVLHFGAAWSQPVEHWPQLPMEWRNSSCPTCIHIRCRRSSCPLRCANCISCRLNAQSNNRRLRSSRTCSRTPQQACFRRRSNR